MDTLGAAIGPVFALILLNLYPGNYRLIFLLAFIPSLIALSFTFVVRDKPTNPVVTRQKIHYLDFWKTAPSGYKKLLILLTIFALANSSDVFLILKSKKISGSDSLAIIGYIYYNIIYALSSYPIGLIADRFGKRIVFIFGLFFFSIVYLGFAISGGFIIMWILFALYGIYAASTEGVAKAWVSDIIPDERRGSAIGLLTMLSSIAVFTGSILAGYLWDSFGAPVPFIVSSVISLAVAITLLFSE
jgi:MFS family permease